MCDIKNIGKSSKFKASRNLALYTNFRKKANKKYKIASVTNESTIKNIEI
jgi:hypothetical protein